MAKSDKKLRAGGRATEAGMSFQAEVGLWFAAKIIGNSPVGARFGLEAGVLPLAVRFETGDGLDDVDVALGNGGGLFLQCKTTMSLERKDDSAFGKSVRQIVSHFVKHKATPDHPALDPLRSALVFAVSLMTPRLGTFQNACRRVGMGGEKELERASQDEQSAFLIFKTHLEQGWTEAGQKLESLDLKQVSAMIRVVHFASGESAATRQDSADLLGRCLFADETKGAVALNGLIDVVRTLIKHGIPADRCDLLSGLRKAGVEDEKSPGYDRDIEKLRALTGDELNRLKHHRFLAVGEGIAITRAHQAALKSAVEEASLLVVGEPGIGKTGTLLELAEAWTASGPVVFISADNLTEPATVTALANEFGLAHPIVEILRNWPGSSKGLLIVDALDSARNPALHKVLLKLIEEIARRLSDRWRVVVSVRTHELRNGERLKAIFGRHPADSDHVVSGLGETRHFAVGPLTEAEIATICAQSDELQSLIATSTPDLRGLFSNLFNLSLAADLLAAGVGAGEFASISTQSDLIDRYEDRRLNDAKAAHAVAAVIEKLVERKALTTPRYGLDADAVDTLLNCSILAEDRGCVGFRHHVIFDHAAARYFLDRQSEDVLLGQIGEAASAGLILAPALRFVLDRMWKEDSSGKSRVWGFFVRLLRRDKPNSVIVASLLRWINESVRTREAAAGLCTIVLSPATPERRMGLFLLLLARFLELTGKTTPLESEMAITWSMVAEQAIRTRRKDYLEGARFILHAIQQSGGLESTDARAAFGSAARALLQRCYVEIEFRHARRHAITFVGISFASDAAASRDVLLPLLEPAHLSQYGHDEAPTLAGRLHDLRRVDPDFAIEIYKAIYSQPLPEPVQSVMGGGRIMPLLTDTRQAFSGALYFLGTALRHFLSEQPRHGTLAVNEAALAEARNAGYLGDARIAVRSPGQKYEIVPTIADVIDWRTRNDADSEERPLAAFQHFLAAERSDQELETVIGAMTSHPTLSSLWCRLLGTLALRPQPAPCQAACWSVATNPLVLQTRGLKREAIAYIKATIGFQANEARQAFEQVLLGHVAENAADWDGARADVLVALGDDDLISQDLSQQQREYRQRHAEFLRASQEEDEKWLAEQEKRKTALKAECAAPENQRLIEALNHLGTLTGNARRDWRAAGEEICRAVETVLEAEKAPNITEVVRRRLNTAIAETISTLCGSVVMSGSDLSLERLLPIVRRLTRSDYPLPCEDTDDHYGVTAHRVYGAKAASAVWQYFGEPASALEEDLGSLAVDSSPSVRIAVAKSLETISRVDLNASWRLAEKLLAAETRPAIAVIAGHSMLAGAGSDLDRAETFFIRCLNVTGTPTRHVDDDQIVGTLICDLAVHAGRQASAAEVSKWLGDLVANEGRLWQIQAQLREPIFWLYQDANNRRSETGRRAQDIFRKIMSAAASELCDTAKEFAALSPGEKAGDPLIQRYQSAGKLLYHGTSQIYFGSGAYQASRMSSGDNHTSETGLVDDGAKRQFLIDWAPDLAVIEGAADPAAINHLVETYEFLLPSEPGYVFDRVATLMLGRGKELGYQAEDLGAGGIVDIVRTCLADHRDIFDEPDRRQRLVDLLEMFAEYGWHAAVELLFELPTLLR
ncbi:hypothetical protein N182_37815 [Sinorhizobium sp. GL2]|nr:hypothetical protein N182_37815 [Sinorhizobium sp. GL2]